MLNSSTSQKPMARRSWDLLLMFSWAIGFLCVAYGVNTRR
jgi:hypothetical protein